MSLEVHYQQENDIGVFRLEGLKIHSDGESTWMRFMRTLEEDDALLVFDNSTSKASNQEVLIIINHLTLGHFPRNKKGRYSYW